MFYLFFSTTKAVGATDLLSCLQTNVSATCRSTNYHGVSNSAARLQPLLAPPINLENAPPKDSERSSRETPGSNYNEFPQVFPDFPRTNKPPSPEEEDQSDSSYGSGGDDYAPRKKPRGRPRPPEEQYYVVRILVRLRYWLEDLWNNFRVLSFNAGFDSSADSMMPRLIRKNYGQELDQFIINSPVHLGFSPHNQGIPHITSTEFLQVDWEEQSEPDQPSSSITMIPAGSQEAFAVIEIPVHVQYSDWNDLDRQMQWRESLTQTLQWLSASWSSLYPDLYELLQQQTVDCQYQVQESVDNVQVSWKCEPGKKDLPVPEIKTDKVSPFMVTLVVLDPPDSASPPDDGIVTTPTRKEKKEQKNPSGKAPSSPATVSGKRKVTFSREALDKTAEDEEEPPEDPNDPISKVKAADRVGETERLVWQLRILIRDYWYTRLLNAGKKKDDFAELLYELYTALGEAGKTSSSSQYALLFYLNSKILEHPTVGLTKKDQTLVMGDFSSLDDLKKKLKKHWDKTKFKRLMVSQMMELFANYLTNHAMITWRMIEYSNDPIRCLNPLPEEAMQKIGEYIKDISRRLTEFPHRITSGSKIEPAESPPTATFTPGQSGYESDSTGTRTSTRSRQPSRPAGRRRVQTFRSGHSQSGYDSDSGIGRHRVRHTENSPRPHYPTSRPQQTGLVLNPDTELTSSDNFSGASRRQRDLSSSTDESHLSQQVRSLTLGRNQQGATGHPPFQRSYSYRIPPPPQRLLNRPAHTRVHLPPSGQVSYEGGHSQQSPHAVIPPSRQIGYEHRRPPVHNSDRPPHIQHLNLPGDQHTGHGRSARSPTSPTTLSSVATSGYHSQSPDQFSGGGIQWPAGNYLPPMQSQRTTSSTTDSSSHSSGSYPVVPYSGNQFLPPPTGRSRTATVSGTSLHAQFHQQTSASQGVPRGQQGDTDEENIERTVRLYKQLVRMLSPESIVALANGLNVDKVKYGMTHAFSLRDERRGEARIIKMIRRFVHLRRSFIPPMEVLRELAKQVKTVYPDFIVDGYFNPSWGFMLSPAMHEHPLPSETSVETTL